MNSIMSHAVDVPLFSEVCVEAGSALPSTRDRSACGACPVGRLCNAGFERQRSLVAGGLDPNLEATVSPELLSQPVEVMLANLTSDEIAWACDHVPGLREGNVVGTPGERLTRNLLAKAQLVRESS